MKDNKSGYYNISAVSPLPLKLIITLIRDAIDPQFILEFGGLPYRQKPIYAYCWKYGLI